MVFNIFDVYTRNTFQQLFDNIMQFRHNFIIKWKCSGAFDFEMIIIR